MLSLNTKQFTTYVQTRKQANREPIVITSCDDGSYIEFVCDRQGKNDRSKVDGRVKNLSNRHRLQITYHPQNHEEKTVQSEIIFSYTIVVQHGFIAYILTTSVAPFTNMV